MSESKEHAMIRPISLEGSLSRRDYNSACNLHLHHLLVRVSIGAVILYFVVSYAAAELIRASREAGFAILGASSLVIIGLIVWGQWRRLKMIWQKRKQRGVFLPKTVVVSSSGIICTAAHMKNEFDWDYFSGYRVNERLILLRIAHNNEFLILAFDNLAMPNQWEDLNHLVASKLPCY
ncbi:MAG: hypothetical protein WEB58_20445 [Planctomycetaceae bacterium]